MEQASIVSYEYKKIKIFLFKLSNQNLAKLFNCFFYKKKILEYSYLPGSIGLSTSAIDLTASTRKRLPHQPRAPVQKVTQVNPKVVRIKDLLAIRLFRSWVYEVAFNCSWPSDSPLGGSLRKNTMPNTATAPRRGVPRRAQCQDPKAADRPWPTTYPRPLKNKKNKWMNRWNISFSFEKMV